MKIGFTKKMVITFKDDDLITVSKFVELLEEIETEVRKNDCEYDFKIETEDGCETRPTLQELVELREKVVDLLC
jgi:hypothetical protein